MMRGMLHAVLRFGVVEFLLLFLLFINIFIISLYIINRRRPLPWVRQRTLKLFFILTMIFSIISLIHIGESFVMGRNIRFHEINFIHENIPADLIGYRIAFMADFHAIIDEAMGGVINELNNRNIDLLLLGGDFSTRQNRYQGTLREIGQAQTTDGIFGVEGNHDDYRLLFAAMEAKGMIPLDNSGVQVRDGLFLGGVRDMWNRDAIIYEAIENASPNDFVILVTHNPDVVMAQSTAGIDLILAGHTHGGQITFFGFPFYLWRGSITQYGTRFGRGFAKSADGVDIFVTTGVGCYYNHPRIFARPEVVIITLIGG